MHNADEAEMPDPISSAIFPLAAAYWVPRPTFDRQHADCVATAVPRQINERHSSLAQHFDEGKNYQQAQQDLTTLCDFGTMRDLRLLFHCNVYFRNRISLSVCRHQVILNQPIRVVASR